MLKKNVSSCFGNLSTECNRFPVSSSTHYMVNTVSCNGNENIYKMNGVKNTAYIQEQSDAKKSSIKKLSLATENSLKKNVKLSETSLLSIPEGESSFDSLY